MLDIRRLREDAEAIKSRIKNRGGDHWKLVDEVLECDEKRRKLETEKQQLQGERKRESKKIGQLRAQGEDTSLIEAAVKKIGNQINATSKEADELEARQQQLLYNIPNTPHEQCPVGSSEEDNPEIKVWGEKPTLDFKPLSHIEIGEKHDLFSFEDGATISGSGYVVYKGAGARLERALIQFLLDLHTREHGYTEINPPLVVRRDCMIGTGQIPKFEEDMYGMDENQMFLAPTAEVPVTNLVRESIRTDLPVSYAAYTPCFRREAGSAGKMTRGLIRMHQFDKVELVKVVRPETSYEELEHLLENAEAVLQLLGLHYRVIELCTGDVGFSSAKTYDIEVWAPGQDDYLEVSSCSNFEDYQARRMKVRYKDEDGKNQFCHTLNGSGTALPRLYVALLETYQQKDGSIVIPEVLQPYFRSDKIGD